MAKTGQTFGHLKAENSTLREQLNDAVTQLNATRQQAQQQLIALIDRIKDLEGQDRVMQVACAFATGDTGQTPQQVLDKSEALCVEWGSRKTKAEAIKRAAQKEAAEKQTAELVETESTPA